MDLSFGGEFSTGKEDSEENKVQETPVNTENINLPTPETVKPKLPDANALPYVDNVLLEDGLEEYVDDPQEINFKVEEDYEPGFLRSVGGDLGEFVTSGEIITAPFEGVTRAIGELADTAASINQWTEDKTGVQFVPYGDKIFGGIKYVTEEIDDLIQDSETVTGALTSGITQFATGMVLTRGIGGKVGTVKSAMTRGAITDAAFFDPDLEGLAELSVATGGIFDNAITQSLLKGEDDSEFTKRAKMATEGLIIGGAFEGVLKAFRNAKAVKEAKTDIEVNGELSPAKAKAVDDSVDELDQWMKIQKIGPSIETVGEAMQGPPKPQGLGSRTTDTRTPIEKARDAGAKVETTSKASKNVDKEQLKKVQDKKKKKYDIERVKEANAEDAAAKRKVTTKVAEENKVLRDRMIRELENTKGIVISRTGDDGLKEIDPELARAESKKLTEKLAKQTEEQTERAKLQQGGKLDEDQLNAIEAIRVATAQDGMFQAMLKPESLDSIVAISADFQKTFGVTIGGGGKTVIDDLFKLTVDKNLIGDERLLDVLAKHQMTFEDYIMTIVGSGSEAGRLMNKLSQISKNNLHKTEFEKQIDAERKATQGSIRNLVLRIENIRRGALVSQVATAARNLSSGLIRMPLEGVANIMDDALYHAGQGNYGKAIGMIKPTNWRGSFTGLKLMTRNPIASKQFTDLILSQPEFASNMDLMFNQLNEMRRHVGQGKGGKIDSVLSVMEKAVDTVNIPNRAQEFLVRRGAFLGELERLVKREWGIDLIETLDKGKLRDMIANSSSVKPAGKNVRSFASLVDSATNKALDVTYAKQPDLAAFRNLSSFITNNGLTAIIPFPRFMFNSIELVAQYAGGASIPMTRKMMKMVGGKSQRAMTEAERKYVSRNITGLGIVGAAYMYRSDKTLAETDSDYKLLKFGKQVLDTSPIFPMRQFMWMGEATKRLMDGTFDDWYDHREAIQTFTGSNLRTGNGNMMFDDIASMIGSEDYLAQRDIGKTAGRAIGNYLSTFAVPFAQIIDAERAAGLIPTTFQDVVNEPSIEGSSFMDELARPFKQRGYNQEALLTGAGVLSEKVYPEREFVLSDDKRRSPLQMAGKVTLGLNLASADPEYGQFYKNLGYTDFKLGSKSKSPAVRRFENKELRKFLIPLAEAGENIAENFGKEFDKKPIEEQNKTTRNSYINDKLKLIIEKQIRSARTKINKAKLGVAPPETRVLLEYSKLSRQVRRTATALYFDKYGDNPDFSDIKDMQKLIEIGKRVR